MKSYVFYYPKRLVWLIYHYLEIFHTSTCHFISSNLISFILLLIALSILCSNTENTIKSADNFSCKLSTLKYSKYFLTVSFPNFVFYFMFHNNSSYILFKFAFEVLVGQPHISRIWN